MTPSTTVPSLDELDKNASVPSLDELEGAKKQPDTTKDKSGLSEKYLDDLGNTVEGSQEKPDPNLNEEAQKKLAKGEKLPGLETPTPGKESNDAQTEVMPKRNAAYSQSIQDKLKGEKPEIYVKKKQQEIINVVNDNETHKTNLTYFSQSDNFKQYIEVNKQLADPAIDHKSEQYKELVKKAQDLEKKPFDVPTKEWSDEGLTQEQLKAKYLPKNIQGVKTIGEAIGIYNEGITNNNSLDTKLKSLQSDFSDVVDAVRANSGIKIAQTGEDPQSNYALQQLGIYTPTQAGTDPLNAFQSLMYGFTTTIDKVAKFASLVQSPEARNQYALEQMGKAIIDPKQPAGLFSTPAVTAGQLAPFFMINPALGLAGITGFGATVGGAFTNGAMMMATNYADAGVAAYKQVYEATGGDEKKALAAFDKAANTNAAIGAVVGGIGLPTMERLGGKLGLEFLDKEAVDGAIKDGTLDASKLSLGQYLAYNLPKGATANTPFLLGKITSNVAARTRGENVGVFDGAFEDYFTAIALGQAVDGLMYAKDNLPTSVKGIFENALAKYGNDHLQETLGKQVEAGTITKAQADEVGKPIQAKADAYKMMPADLTVDQQNAVLPLLVENSKLLTQGSKSVFPNQGMLAKVEANNRKILEATEAPLTDKEKDEMAKLKADEKTNGGKLPRLDRDKLTHFENRLDAIDATKKAKEEANKPKEEPKVEPPVEEKKKDEAVVEKPEENKSVKPTDEAVNQHINDNYAEAKAEIDTKLKSGEITREEARKQWSGLQDKATKELAAKRNAESKASREALKPEVDAFDEYEKASKKKGIRKANAIADFLDKNGEKGAAIKAISDHWSELKAELEKAKLLEINCD